MWQTNNYKTLCQAPRLVRGDSKAALWGNRTLNFCGSTKKEWESHGTVVFSCI